MRKKLIVKINKLYQEIEILKRELIRETKKEKQNEKYR